MTRDTGLDDNVPALDYIVDILEISKPALKTPKGKRRDSLAVNRSELEVWA